MSILATSAFALAGLSALVQALFLLSPRLGCDRLSHWLVGASSVLLAALIALRSFTIGFPALTGTYESLVFYAACLGLLLVWYRLQGRLPYSPALQFWATVAVLGLLAVASSPIAPKAALAPIPALRSGWLLAHVALSFVGEALFASAFVASAAFLLTRDAERKAAYDRVAYAAVAVGYPIFTAGALVFGAVWAQNAWGSWWSWDPKETWALVTWLVYSACIHLRLTRPRSSPLPHIASALGFLCTVFTFFGVNYLLAGLHSYG
jgi:ABC-type transport system involved in cytochrome c biogenesis permease subunit